MEFQQEQNKQLDILIKFLVSALFSNVDIDAIKQYKPYKIILSKSIKILLFTHKLCCVINNNFALKFTLQMAKFLIHVLSYTFYVLCNFHFAKPLYKAHTIYFYNLMDTDSIFSLQKSNIDYKQVETWKNMIKGNIESIDDGTNKLAFANKIIKYEKNKNRKLYDVQYIWHIVHNTNFIPYILNNVMKMKSTADIGNIFSHFKGSNLSLTKITQTIIATHNIALLDTVVKDINTTQEATYSKLILNGNIDLIMAQYSHIKNSQITAIIKQLKSSNKLTFSVGKEYLIDLDIMISKKYVCIVLMSVILAQIFTLYINYVKSVAKYNNTNIKNHYMSSSMKFIEMLLVDDIITPSFIYNLKENLPSNPLLYYNCLNDKLRERINSLLSKTKNIQCDMVVLTDLVWTVFDYVSDDNHNPSLLQNPKAKKRS